MIHSYKFRCALVGHTSDVRGLVCPTDKLVISASRDFTARVWSLPEEHNDVKSDSILRGHENYVSAVTVQMAADSEPVVFTGSNDKVIRAYALGATEPTYCLRGHEDTVCALAVSECGSLVSTSWDKSTKIWRDRSCILTITGHEAAVWCVLLMPSKSFTHSANSDLHILTGSADHTICAWSVNGVDPSKTTKSDPCYSLIRTFKGHCDCVRSLSKLDASRLLSASNDASIRAWNVTTGDCIGEFYGHTSFVYAVATLPAAQIFVSSGEDRCVRVWPVPSMEQCGIGRQFSSIQSIPLPCQSVWCVALTPLLDIVAGGSDSVIRVFSGDPSRQASADVLKTYEAELSSSKIVSPNASAADDLDMSKLPGIEALQLPGKREGHVIVIQQQGRSVCYQWSSGETRWLEIGDVVGTGSAKLPVHNGKEYDFVFSVDISDDRPALKLPYNRTEDPWIVAQQFIHEHDLPQDYLDTVAQFIIKNAGPQLHSNTSAEPVLSDPFTGADRYVPTGLEMYSPRAALGESYFPSETFISLKSISLNPLVSKLELFNVDVKFPLDTAQLDLIRRFSFELNELQALELTVVLLDTISKWPLDKVFPLLDILRCLVFWSRPSELIFDEKNWSVLRNLSFAHSDLPSANCLLVLRLLANAVAADGPSFLQKSAEHRTSATTSLMTLLHLIPQLVHLVDNVKMDISQKKSHQVALSALIHNLSVLAYLSAVHKINNESILPRLRVLPSLCLRMSLSLLCLAPERGPSGVTLFHPEAVFSLILALGTSLMAASRDTDHNEQPTEAVKAYRVRLIVSAATPSTGDTNEFISVEDELAGWESTRRIIAYWSQTPTCLPKVRSSAAALLRLLE